MEDGVFSARIRGIFDGIASGAWPFLKMVVIPRTSEQEHKLFLYLREVARQGLSTGLPDLYLYNLLHTRSSEAELMGWSEPRNSGTISSRRSRIRRCEESNRATSGYSKPAGLRRRSEPRLSGTEALALIGASVFHGSCGIRTACRRSGGRDLRPYANRRPAHPDQRISAPPHRLASCHRVAPCGYRRGRRLVGLARARNGNRRRWRPVRAIFETYYREAPSPREISNSWFLANRRLSTGLSSICRPKTTFWDGIIRDCGKRSISAVFLPCLLREDAANQLSSECHQRIEDFVRKLDT